MLRITRWLTPLGLMLAAWLAAAPAAWAQGKGPPKTIQDDANFFSAEARARANAQIAEIKREFGKDLVIETVPKVERPASVQKGNKEQMKQFFDEWAMERFRRERDDGILIVLVKEPHILRVVVGKKTREGGLFTRNDRIELDKLMLAKLSEGKRDEALTGATALVLNKMRDNAPTAVKERPRQGGAAAPPVGGVQRRNAPPRDAGTPGIGGYSLGAIICFGIVVLAVIWLVIGIIRAISNRGAPGYGYGGGGPGYAGGPGYGGGGGGFFSSLLGGMFGAAAGMWMYNHFFGGGTPHSYGGDYGAGAGGAAGGGAADVGGGGYGDDAGQVGDVGGGEYGGGDAGGGDWGGGGGGGGGGGDWGGGGGDWGGGGGGGGGDWGGGGGDWGGGGGGGGDWGGGGGGGGGDW